MNLTCVAGYRVSLRTFCLSAVSPFQGRKLGRGLASILLLLTLCSFDQLPEVAGDEKPASASIAPVTQWRFESEDTSKLKSHDGVHRDQHGPRPPHFPNFADDNAAVLLDGAGAYLSLEDPGADSQFDFGSGDNISLEAWLDPHEIGDGAHVYVVGKGRTGNKGFDPDNQNWALRLKGEKEQAFPNFLFSTKDDGKQTRWHRWTASHGFKIASGWHHVMLTYQFGSPKSLRCWVDGQTVQGQWDMDGETAAAPVPDNDEIWIGSSMKRQPAASFVGFIDDISLYRQLTDDAFVATRYLRVGDAPPSVLPQPELPPLEYLTNSVTLTIREGLPSHARWPLVKEYPAPLYSSSGGTGWSSPYFFLPRLPRRFDEHGVRASYRAPVLIHLSSQIHLPAGETHFVIRNRGIGRLWVDGEVKTETTVRTGTSDGHDDVRALATPPLPGHRILRPGDKETIATVSFDREGDHQIAFETMIGGANSRAEPGEMLIGYWQKGADRIHLLQAQDSNRSEVAMMDGPIESLRTATERSLIEWDDRIRRSTQASQMTYWQMRHDAAAKVAAKQLEAAPHQSIDAWIDERIEKAVAARGQSESRTKLNSDETQQANAVSFHRDVLPILREHCHRCHNETAEGGLNLLSRDAALLGGDSGEPAVAPNHPETSSLVSRIYAEGESERMPPSGQIPAEQAQLLVNWIKAGASWDISFSDESIAKGRSLSDTRWLRRLYLDTVGVPPTSADLRRFVSDGRPEKYASEVDRVLADDRYADHWTSFWQDLLAENPNILKPSLNNTGPFRWYLHDSLRDNLPLDRMVTELIMLRGSEREGGAAGFGMAADNDAPLAARGYIAMAAVLGIQLQCARCHDSPYHSTKQQDLFSIAAMLSRGDVTVPKTSTVSPGFFENKGGRQSLIKVTLKPGVPVKPIWPFAGATGAKDSSELDQWLENPKDTRERLAALVTCADNQRFPRVMVNHLWKRLFGAGIVEPAHDWEAAQASDPQLLDWLANRFVAGEYDAKAILKIMLLSDLYRREAIGNNHLVGPEERFFASPDRRRLSAEQVVDSLFACSGQTMDVEELTFDPEALRPANTMISLGKPQRAWQFSTLSNERDRPSLALPRAQAVTDVLEAFGWTGSRQNLVIDREVEPGVLQPGMVANGVMSSWIAKASANSELANLAMNASDLPSLITEVYQRFLSRNPTDSELAAFTAELEPGFEQRRLPSEQVAKIEHLTPLQYVSWANHLKADANLIKIEEQRRAAAGDPPDPRIEPQWRERYEDFVWAILNSPEFVFVP